MLPYHVEAKVYEHEGLVEEKVDVEKTQKSEQKVEKVFDDVPSPVELQQRLSCDKSLRDSCTVGSAQRNKSSLKWRR